MKGGGKPAQATRVRSPAETYLSRGALVEDGDDFESNFIFGSRMVSGGREASLGAKQSFEKAMKIPLLHFFVKRNSNLLALKLKHLTY